MEEKYQFRVWLAGSIIAPLLFVVLFTGEGWMMPSVSWWIAFLALVASYCWAVGPFFSQQVKRKWNEWYGAKPAALYVPQEVQLTRRRRIAIDPLIIIVATAVVFGGIVSFATYRFATATPGPLDLTFMSMATGKHKIFEGTNRETYAVVMQPEITNHSDTNMSLIFTLLIRTRLKSGERSACAAQGEWKNSLLDKQSFNVLNLARESTADGALIFRLPPPEDFEFAIDSWDDVSYDKMVLKIEDKVSGATVMGGPMHYPPARSFSDIY
jgi:hypothetical protein